MLSSPRAKYSNTSPFFQSPEAQCTMVALADNVSGDLPRSKSSMLSLNVCALAGGSW